MGGFALSALDRELEQFSFTTYERLRTGGVGLWLFPWPACQCADQRGNALLLI